MGMHDEDDRGFGFSKDGGETTMRAIDSRRRPEEENFAFARSPAGRILMTVLFAGSLIGIIMPIPKNKAAATPTHNNQSCDTTLTPQNIHKACISNLKSIAPY